MHRHGIPTAAVATSGLLAVAFVVAAAIATPAAATTAPDSTRARAPADSAVLRGEPARHDSARETAHRDSLSALRDLRGAETELWRLPPAQKTVDEQIAALKDRLLIEPQNADLYDDLGALYASRQEWTEARDAYIAAVQSNRERAGCHRGLALAAARLGTWSLAANEFEVYQRLDPQGGQDAWRLAGAVWKLAGKRDKARQAFETGLSRLAPGTGAERLRLVLGLLPLVQDKEGPVAARLLLERFLPEARPPLAVAAPEADSTLVASARAVVTNLLALTISEANARAGSGARKEAADLYAKAFDLAPERDDLLVFAVDASVAAGDVPKARTMQAAAAAAAPDAPGVWLAAGRIAEAEGRLPEAIAAYDRSLALKPGQPDVQLRVGTLYLKTGDRAGARKYMDAVMADPDAPAPVLYGYGIALIQDQKYDLAVAPLRRAVAAAPQMAAAWAALGSSLQAAGKHAEAIDPYQTALALEKDPATLAGLALCFVRTGQIDQAVATYRDLLVLAPDTKGARYNLGRTLYDAKRYQEAIPVLEQALNIDPTSYQIYFLLGVCQYQAGDFERAVEMFNGALANRRTADALQNLGLALDKQGKKEEAQKCYKEAQDLRAAGK